MIRLINELSLDSGKVYKSDGVWYVDGEKWELNRPRIGESGKAKGLTMTYREAVVIENRR